MKFKLAVLAALLFLPLSLFAQSKGYYYAVKAGETVQADNLSDKAFWKRAEWYPMDEPYVGEMKEGLSGRFKAAWEGSQIYLLVEVTDNNLTNFINESFENYWQGDCVEVFIDEALNKCDHYQNNKAFAYHIMNTGETIDIDTDGNAKIFPKTAVLAIKREGNNRYLWQIVLNVYSEKYDPNAKDNTGALVSLYKGKKLGFTVAYADNDGQERTAFYGSTPGQGDSGYETSEHFGTLELIK